MPSRSEIACSASDALEKVSGESRGLVGFDGFIDSIIHMVDTRVDMSPTGYRRLNTIGAFAMRCAGAAGKSTNIEQVLIEKRFGGNGPLMAGALARLGMKITYIGAVAQDTVTFVPHPVFASFVERCDRVIGVCEPSTTDCLEFDDGKLMFNNTANVQDVTWARVVERVGLDNIIHLAEESALLGIVNWSLQGGVPGIWDGLRREVFPNISQLPGGRRIFIDLSDPAKRTDEDIREALEVITSLEQIPGVNVTLGLNFSESQRIAQAANINAYPGNDTVTMSQSLTTAAVRIREGLNLDTVVVHPREGAAAANARGDQGWFEGPFTAHPKLSTGAGDHFNGGFAFAQVHGLSLEGCLAAGTATSGAYVRDAQSPDRQRLIEFLRVLPGRE
jgi:sugar/nucleoside kinase (ribokinase family)